MNAHSPWLLSGRKHVEEYDLVGMHSAAQSLQPYVTTRDGFHLFRPPIDIERKKEPFLLYAKSGTG